MMMMTLVARREAETTTTLVARKALETTMTLARRAARITAKEMTTMMTTTMTPSWNVIRPQESVLTLLVVIVSLMNFKTLGKTVS